MLALTKPVRHIGVDIDLPENVIAPADQYDELRLGEQIARQIIPDRTHIGDVLIAPFRDRRAAHACANRDARMFGFAPGECLEHQLVAVEHVRVHGRVGRAPGADPLAGHREQRLAPVVVQVRRAERTHDLGRFGCRARGHVPRLPSTAVARRSTPSRLLTIATVSPGWWLRSASVMSYKLAMCLSPIAVITSPAASPACSAGLPARTPVMRTPSEMPPPLM